MRSRSRSATGWPAAGTRLAALTGSLAGWVPGAAAGAVADLSGSAAGTVWTLDGVLEGCAVAVFCAGAAAGDVATDLPASCAGDTDAVLSDLMSSSLKSLAVGGGTLAGSGRGIAASIASSAALLRG